MIEFRKNHSVLRDPHFFRGEINERGMPDVQWHGCHLNSPGWSDPEARALAMTIAGFDGEDDIHVMMNMYWESLTFEVPSLQGRSWYYAVVTAALPPNDIADPGAERPFQDNVCTVQPRSIVALISKPV